MKAKILFFAILREKLKQSEAEVEIQTGETVSQLAHRILKPALGEENFERCLLFAMGDEYIGRDYQPKQGDEIAFIPPVAGG
jgi:molybdopterin converting factor subunit 1